MCRRTGLSRIEVVLLLLIMALIAGLIVPAVARIRESAGRMTCANNLKQLALGIHNYHDIFRRFPPLTDQGEGAPTGNGLPSMFANLMPYLEASPGFFHEGWEASRYHAHSSVSFNYDHKDGTTGTQLPWGRKGLDSISAGTLNVIMLAERPQVCRTASGEDVYNLWGVGFYSPQMPAFATLTPTEPPGLGSTGQIAPVEPLPEANAPDRDTMIRVKIGRADAVPELPDFSNPIQMLRKKQPCDPRLPGTQHAFGMPVVMADASVRVFTPDTTPWIFWSACTPTKP
ncbi:MAG: DUF1559 domain-containing protein [Planctomycetes bacterium]|nr:DUF1559 domain-containing protein [Planctomycetota bacterium]